MATRINIIRTILLIVAWSQTPCYGRKTLSSKRPDLPPTTKIDSKGRRHFQHTAHDEFQDRLREHLRFTNLQHRTYSDKVYRSNGDTGHDLHQENFLTYSKLKGKLIKRTQKSPTEGTFSFHSKTSFKEREKTINLKKINKYTFNNKLYVSPTHTQSEKFKRKNKTNFWDTVLSPSSTKSKSKLRKFPSHSLTYSSDALPFSPVSPTSSTASSSSSTPSSSSDSHSKMSTSTSLRHSGKPKPVSLVSFTNTKPKPDTTKPEPHISIPKFLASLPALKVNITSNKSTSHDISKRNAPSTVWPSSELPKPNYDNKRSLLLKNREKTDSETTSISERIMTQTSDLFNLIGNRKSKVLTRTQHNIRKHNMPPLFSSSELTKNYSGEISKSRPHSITKRNALPSFSSPVKLINSNHSNPSPSSEYSLLDTEETHTPPTTNGSDRITLHIGGLFELTGHRHGGNGPSELLATQMAIAHVNQQGIIPGYRLKLLYNDSQCDAGVGTDAFYDLVYRKSRNASLVMVMGGSCNEVTMTLAEIVNSWEIVMISFTADSPALSEREKYRTFFRMALGHSALDPPRRMLLEHFKWSKVAILYEEVEALSLAFNTFQKDLASHGITVTSAKSLKNARVETPEKLRNLKDKDVRIILAGFSEPVARMVLCEAYKMGLTGSRHVWILVGGLRRRWWKLDEPQDSNCTVEELSRAVNGMFTVFGLNKMLPGDTSIGNLTYEEFLDEYNSLNGSHPTTMFTVIAYDTVWTMALAIRDTLERWEENGTALPLHQLNNHHMKVAMDDLRDSVESLSFSGVSGPVSFDSSDREGVSVVYQIQDGNYTPVALHMPHSDNLDFHCDLCKDILWADGNAVPKDSQRMVPRMIVILPSVFYPAVALCMGGIIMAIFFLSYNLYYRRLKFIKLSSPNLNNVAVLGCIMAYCDVILLGLDDTNLNNHVYSIICTARAFLLSSGFSLAFGAMFAKTFRVHRIFTRANRGLLKSRLIRDSHLLVIIGVLLVLDMGLVCTWVVVDPMTRVIYNLTQQVSDDDPDLVYQEQLTTCYSDHLQEWLGAFYAYKGLLLVFGLYMAWETRHVKIPALNDSQYIGLNVYNVVIMAVCVVVISNIVSTRPNLAYGMVASFMILSTTVTLCLLFVPKMCAIVASKGNPIVASSGILVDRSNTRRFVFDDRKEVLYRAEVQNRVYKREIMELDQKICRLERLLDIPLHPIPRLTEELLYLLPETLGERAAPIGFRRGRRRALEWCNSISDGGEGVTWSATDSDDLNTETSLLSPLSPGHNPGIGKPGTGKLQESLRRKASHNNQRGIGHGKHNLNKASKSNWAGKEKRVACTSPCSLKCGTCKQCKSWNGFHANNSSSSSRSAKTGKGVANKSYCKAVCRRNHKRKEKESNSINNKDLNYSMVHQTLKLLNLSVPAVPFPERIDQARSLPEIFESKTKESLDENLMKENEIRTASSDQAVANKSGSPSSRLNSPKKLCGELHIEIPCNEHLVGIGDIQVEEANGSMMTKLLICSDTENDNDDDYDDDDNNDDYIDDDNDDDIERGDDNDDDNCEMKYSQMSPSQSWPSLDFRDDVTAKSQGNRHKNKLLKQATVFSVSEFQIVSFDDNDENTSGDENGNDIFDSDEGNNDDDDTDDEVCVSCNDELCLQRQSLISLDRNENGRDNIFYDRKEMNVHHNESFETHDSDTNLYPQHRPHKLFCPHKHSLDNDKALKGYHNVHFSEHKPNFYLPLDPTSTKSESCPRVDETKHDNHELEFQDARKRKSLLKNLHFSADNLTQRYRKNWLKDFFKPKLRHNHPPHSNNYSSCDDYDNNNQNNNTPYQCLHLSNSNQLFDHHASDPTVPISTTLEDDSFSEKSRLLPSEDYDEHSQSSLSPLTTWRSCSAIDPSFHYDNNRKSSLPANNIISTPSNPSPSLPKSPLALCSANVKKSNFIARETILKNYNNSKISQVISRSLLHNKNANRSAASCFSSPHDESSSLLLSSTSSNSSLSPSSHHQQNLPFHANAKDAPQQSTPFPLLKPPPPSSTKESSSTGNQISSPSTSSSSSTSPQQTQPPTTSSLPTSSEPQHQLLPFPDSNSTTMASLSVNKNPFTIQDGDKSPASNNTVIWPLADRNKESSIPGINSGRSEYERLDEVSEF